MKESSCMKCLGGSIRPENDFFPEEVTLAVYSCNEG